MFTEDQSGYGSFTEEQLVYELALSDGKRTPKIGVNGASWEIGDVFVSERLGLMIADLPEAGAEQRYCQIMNSNLVRFLKRLFTHPGERQPPVTDFVLSTCNERTKLWLTADNESFVSLFTRLRQKLIDINKLPS